MQIGIDIRVLAKGARTGIEEYALNLLDSMVALKPDARYKFFYNAFSKVPLEYPWLKAPNAELREFRLPNRFVFDPFSYFFNFPKIDRLLGGIDVLFSPHFLISALSKTCPRTITFHDLSFWHYPNFFSPRKRWWHLSLGIKNQARAADKIIAVSNSTKQDLVNFWKINPEKIFVIHSGIAENFKPRPQNDPKLEHIKKKYNLPDNFIFYFGTIEPRKNIIALIKAFERCASQFQNEDLRLVIAGRLGWLFKDIIKTARTSKFKEKIIFTGFIDDVDKPYIYNLAKIFVYPSFFEGFGFPPLEAMASGVPTITSNASSLPEIVGDAGIMIDPYKIDELAAAMEFVLSDAALRRELVRKGLERTKQFSWEKTARETLRVLTNN